MEIDDPQSLTIAVAGRVCSKRDQICDLPSQIDTGVSQHE